MSEAQIKHCMRLLNKTKQHFYCTCFIFTLSLSPALSHTPSLFFCLSLSLSHLLPPFHLRSFSFSAIRFLSPLLCQNSLSFLVYHTHTKSPSLFFNDYLINTYNACICSLCVTLFVKILTQQGSKQYFIGVPGIKNK